MALKYAPYFIKRGIFAGVNYRKKSGGNTH